MGQRQCAASSRHRPAVFSETAITRAAISMGDEEVLQAEEITRGREAAVWFIKFSDAAEQSPEDLKLFARWILQDPQNVDAFLCAGGTFRKVWK